MPRRRNIRQAVLARDGRTCAVCGNACLDDAEVDHVVPIALGGADEAGQCRVLCKACHKRKTRGDVGKIARAKRVGKRETVFQQRMREKAGNA